MIKKKTCDSPETFTQLHAAKTHHHQKPTTTAYILSEKKKHQIALDCRCTDIESAHLIANAVHFTYTFLSFDRLLGFSHFLIL